MIQIRRGEDRGHFDHGWLSTYHTFLFADYRDPKFMGFRSLRVINEDWVIAGEGFDTHGHRDMEIITYVVEGALEHKDSMGTGSVIRPVDVQRMSAGTGVEHSEFNHSKDEAVHLLQIWILPEKHGIKPSYEEKKYPESEKLNRLRLVASQDAREGSVKVHQDMSLYASVLDAEKTVRHSLAQGRHAWIQVVHGDIQVNGKTSKLYGGAFRGNFS